MASDDPPFSKKTARILSFRRGMKGLPPAGPGQGLIEELAKYERGPANRSDATGEYRHRMIVNAAAFVFVAALMVAGWWIADTMARMRKDQDCVLSGRRNCSPVAVIPKARW